VSPLPGELPADRPDLHDEDEARRRLERLRWPDGPVCPHCRSRAITRLHGAKHRKGTLQCNDCRRQFTVTVGTAFHRTKVPLHTWLQAAHLLCAGREPLSVDQLHLILGVTYKTAWFMSHRIRQAIEEESRPVPPPSDGRHDR